MTISKEMLDVEIAQAECAVSQAEQQTTFAKGAVSVLKQLRDLLDTPEPELVKEDEPCPLETL